VAQIYLRKVVEALNSPNGRETFKQIATLMDEIITEWKDYTIPLERRLEVRVACYVITVSLLLAAGGCYCVMCRAIIIHRKHDRRTFT
jgi:hypothetical protein